VKSAGQARVITIVMLTAIGLFIATRKREPQPTALVSKPQDAIYAMLDAARTGDVEQYLSYYTGGLAESLRQSVTGKYLRETNEPIKGIAVNEPQQITDREVKVRVEFVYQDRNEAQIFYLQKAGEQWRIANLGTAERLKTLAPYGSPAQ
jgi:hypothetical protein